MFNVVLQWINLSKLVSVMEHNPCCSIDGLYDECESQFLMMIGTAGFEEQEDEVKDKLYEAG